VANSPILIAKQGLQSDRDPFLHGSFYFQHTWMEKKKDPCENGSFSDFHPGVLEVAGVAYPPRCLHRALL